MSSRGCGGDIEKKTGVARVNPEPAGGEQTIVGL